MLWRSCAQRCGRDYCTHWLETVRNCYHPWAWKARERNVFSESQQELKLWRSRPTGTVVAEEHCLLHWICLFMWLYRWIYHNILVHSTVEGHLGYFQIFVLKNVSLRIFLYLPVGVHVDTFLLSIYTGVEFLGHSIYESSSWTAKLFFKVCVPIYIPLTVYKNSSFSLVLSTLAEERKQDGITDIIRYQHSL